MWNLRIRKLVPTANSWLCMSAFATTVAAQGEDDRWASGFALPGMQGAARAATTYAGDLVVGGDFVYVTDRQANYVVRWDGSAWQPLANGVSAAVLSAAVYDGRLAVGHSEYARIAIDVWDGTSWS